MMHMSYITKHAKRIATDAGGYGLIILGVALGWLPGPGGIPLIVAGLGLLSINNVWAANLRDYLLKHGGDLVKVLFPPNPIVQWLYDIVVALLLVLVAFLAWRHAAIWQVSLSIGIFFFALFIAVMNRDRLHRLKRSKRKH
ncbi:MAG: putative transrane protein [Candidatus Saccharibacteria bacterium]|nr:putative transrane protein [Candidatus Saccharibacteria bacterium]